MSMLELLKKLRALLPMPRQDDRTPRLGENTSRDYLPPVLGPSDWSDGLVRAMADSGAAWYFDRH
jgi:hypothetical protein